MKITLLRHGRPEFELAGNLKARDLGKMAKSYDLSGIVGNAPNGAIDLSKDHDIVVCSDLPRSKQSTTALGVAEVYLAAPLFNEISIPHFSTGSIKLPVTVWIVVLRCLWYLGFSSNGESICAAKERAKRAAQELITLANQFDRVLLVGHGAINFFIARELLSNNWSGPAYPSSNYWDFSVYQYIAD